MRLQTGGFEMPFSVILIWKIRPSPFEPAPIVTPLFVGRAYWM